MVLGVLSLFICPIVLGPIAMVMGNNALKEIDAAPGRYSNRQSVVIGRILGIVGLVLGILAVVLWVVLLLTNPGGGS